MVYDEDGSSDTVAFEVTVLDTPPTFELALPVDPVEGMATTYSVVNMSDPGTNENEFVVLWDFGDGKEGVGPEATHTYDSHGSYQGHVTVRDDDGTTTQIDWPDLLVVLNAAPTLDVGKQRYSLTEDKEFTLPLFARDPSSQTFIFDFTGPGGTLDPETGIFTWTPTDSDVGSHVFNFSVSDEEGAVAHQEVVLDIEDVDNDFMGMSLAIGMGMILALVLVIVLLAALVVWRRRRPPRAEPSPDEDSVNPEEGNEDEEEHLAAENTAESQHNEPPPQHDTTYEDLYGEPPPSH